MKILSYTFILTFLISALSCSGLVTHDRLMTGTIVKDCTGTYIKDESTQNDYLVCNQSLLKDKTEGAKVQIIYDFTKECKEREGIVICMMYHENKGTIAIKSIK